MKKKDFKIYAHSPEDDENPARTLGIDLKILLDFLEEGWKERFREIYGRDFDLENDIIDANGKKVIFDWINEVGVSYKKMFPTLSRKWLPEQPVPIWVAQSPTYLLLALKIIKEGKPLNEMHWKKFEKLIAELLEQEGWKVELTKGSKDGGVDVIAKKFDSVLGDIKSVWQAKKYSNSNLVRLSHVRELSAVRESFDATKGIIVTTSRLTKDAIEWIKRDAYKLSFKENEQLIEWILKHDK